MTAIVYPNLAGAMALSIRKNLLRLSITLILLLIPAFPAFAGDYEQEFADSIEELVDLRESLGTRVSEYESRLKRLANEADPHTRSDLEWRKWAAGFGRSLATLFRLFDRHFDAFVVQYRNTSSTVETLRDLTDLLAARAILLGGAAPVNRSLHPITEYGLQEFITTFVPPPLPLSDGESEEEEEEGEKKDQGLGELHIYGEPLMPYAGCAWEVPVRACYARRWG